MSVFVHLRFMTAVLDTSMLDDVQGPELHTCCSWTRIPPLQAPIISHRLIASFGYDGLRLNSSFLLECMRIVRGTPRSPVGCLSSPFAANHRDIVKYIQSAPVLGHCSRKNSF